MSENIKRMLAERAALSKPVEYETDRLFELEADKRLFRYLDEGWNGEGWKPSALLRIGYSALMTIPNKSEDYCEERATLFWRTFITEARDRYRCGYYADPFTNSPRYRADITPPGWPAL